MNFEWYWKPKTAALAQNPVPTTIFPNTKTRKLANNRMTYKTTLFVILSLIRLCKYIYSLSPYHEEDTVFPSERPISEWCIWKQSLLFWECTETHKCIAWPQNIFILELKLAVCTPTIRVFKENCSSLKLSCLKWSGASNCH